MVTKKTMEVFATTDGKIFECYEDAFEEDKRERIIALLKKVIGSKYYLLDNEYKMISDFIYDRFESIEEIVNEWVKKKKCLTTE